MDEIQNLSAPLSINKDNNLKNINFNPQTTKVNHFEIFKDLDLRSLLTRIQESEVASKAELVPIENQKSENDKDEDPESPSKRPRVKHQEEKNIDLSQLYHEILMSKVFDKYFEVAGEADFVSSKVIETQEARIERMLVYQKNCHQIHIITYIQGKEEKLEYIILEEQPNFRFEYFEFTNDENVLIAGNRALVVLWNFEKNSIVDGHCLEFSKSEDFKEVECSGDLNNYKSRLANEGLDIYFNVGRFMFNLTVKVEYASFLYVESVYCCLNAVPRFAYVNIEEMVILVVTSGKNFDENAKEFTQTFTVINPENMQVVDPCLNEKNYFDDIYFKFSGNSSYMQLKVIRKLENRLFLRDISISSVVLAGESRLTVSYSNESAITPEFFLKNDVKSIENSIFSSLMISYSTKSFLGQSKSEKTVLMDYNLRTEIKKFKSLSIEGSSLIHDKLIFRSSESILTIYSLSQLKADPFLDLNKTITKISIASPFIFITTDEPKVYCFILYLTSKGAISPVLTDEDIEYMNEKLPPFKRKYLIAALCNAKDSENLKVYLDWKIKHLTSDNYERLPLKETIEGKTLACTEILLQHILEIDEDFSEMRLIFDEIENNFENILSSGCPSIPSLLDKLFTQSLEYGTPKSEYLPLYQTYDFRGSSLRCYFFDSSTENDKDHILRTSLIKTPDTLGTFNSLKLTKCLCEVEDMKIFGTDFIKTYIRSKWADLRSGILGLTFLMWVNIILVACLVTENPNPYYFYFFLLVNVLLVSFELIQGVNLGFQEYIGIDDINYSSVLQISTSFFLVFVYSSLPLDGVFLLLQAFTVEKVLKKIRDSGLAAEMAFLGLPSFLFLFVLVFTATRFTSFLYLEVLS